MAAPDDPRSQAGAYSLFLDEIRRLRIDACLVREGLADLLNVTPAQIDRWENGTDPVDVIVLREWARACGASFMAVATRLDEALATGARITKPTE